MSYQNYSKCHKLQAVVEEKSKRKLNTFIVIGAEQLASAL